MGALLRRRALFLHIPKTGGSWVRSVLRNLGLVRMEFPDTHPDMDRVLHLPRYYPHHFVRQSVKHQSVRLAEEVRSSYKFCVVRNPHSWYESYWRYMMGRNWNIGTETNRIFDTTWKPNSILLRYGSQNFNEFMGRVLNEHPGFLTQMYGRYAPPGSIDFVGGTESLVDDLVTVLNTLGLDFDEDEVRNTEKINTSPDCVDRPEWDDALRTEVRRMEAPIFERFGYE